jgi:hypothetical protein
MVPAMNAATSTSRRPSLTVVPPDEAPTLPPPAVTVLRRLVVSALDLPNRSAGPDDSIGVAS